MSDEEMVKKWLAVERNKSFQEGIKMAKTELLDQIKGHTEIIESDGYEYIFGIYETEIDAIFSKKLPFEEDIKNMQNS